MVDKVKPLKIEDATSGTDIDVAPVEADPTEDYLAGKGIAVENSDSLLIDAAGGEIQFTDTVSGTKKVSDLLDAEQEDFDPMASGLASTKTGPAIREVNTNVATSASPGFTWGKGGSAGPGEYLYNDNVESNKAGRLVPFDGTVTTFFANNEQNSGSRTLELRRRRPCQTGSWTTIASVTIPNGDYCGAFTVSAAVLEDDELAIRVASGSNDFENVIVGVIIKN